MNAWRRSVPAVDPAERDDVDRRLLREHRSDLAGRRVRSQDGVVVHVERVLRVAGGVRLGRVQRREVVEHRVDLGAVEDAVTESEEDVLDLPADLRE